MPYHHVIIYPQRDHLSSAVFLLLSRKRKGLYGTIVAGCLAPPHRFHLNTSTTTWLLACSSMRQQTDDARFDCIQISVEQWQRSFRWCLWWRDMLCQGNRRISPFLLDDHDDIHGHKSIEEVFVTTLHYWVVEWTTCQLIYSHVLFSVSLSWQTVRKRVMDKK